MKKELGDHHFARDDDVMNAVNHFLRDQNDATEGNCLLHDRWTKCVNVGVDYGEQLLYLIFKTDSFYLRPWTYQSHLAILKAIIVVTE